MYTENTRRNPGRRVRYRSLCHQPRNTSGCDGPCVADERWWLELGATLAFTSKIPVQLALCSGVWLPRCRDAWLLPSCGCCCEGPRDCRRPDLCARPRPQSFSFTKASRFPACAQSFSCTKASRSLAGAQERHRSRPDSRTPTRGTRSRCHRSRSLRTGTHLRRLGRGPQRVAGRVALRSLDGVGISGAHVAKRLQA
jgi:hypothetical protein